MATFIINEGMLKRLQPEFFGRMENIKIDDPLAAPEPEPIDLGRYHWLYSHVPWYTPIEVRFCEKFEDWYSGGDEPEKSCKQLKTSEACVGLDPKELRTISKECTSILAEHKQAKDNVIAWVGKGIAALALVAGAAWKFSGSILKKLITEPDFARRLKMELDTIKKEIAAEESFKGRWRLRLGGIIRLLRVAMGVKPTEMQRNEAAAAQFVVENRQQIASALSETRQRLTNFFNLLVRAGYQDQLEYTTSVDITPLSALEGEYSVEDLNQTLVNSTDMVRSYLGIADIIEGHFLPILLSQSGEDLIADRTNAFEMVLRHLNELRAYSQLMDSLRVLNHKIDELVRVISAAYSVRPEMLIQWHGTTKRIQTLIHDISNLVLARLSTVSILQADLAVSGGIAEDNVQQTAAKVPSIATLEGMVQAVTGVHTNDARKTGVAIEIDRLPRIPIDASLRLPLYRVLTNLISNSIKYSVESLRRPEESTPASTTVTTTKPKVERAFVRISAETKEGYLIISVSDNGVGIPDLSKAIAGARLHPDMAEGKGLGLQSAFRQARLAGIEIQAFTSISPDNHGTMFILKVPLDKNLPENRNEQGGTSGGYPPVTPTPSQTADNPSCTGIMGQSITNPMATKTEATSYSCQTPYMYFGGTTVFPQTPPIIIPPFTPAMP